MLSDFLPDGWKFAPMGWEAIVGLAAVFGAYRIGVRQMKITQTQNAVAEMSVKVELFDRRFAVYEATIEFLTIVFDDRAENRRSVLKNYLTTYRQSQFLFRDDVYGTLGEIANNGTESVDLLEKISAGKSSQEATKIITELLLWRFEMINNLHEIFYPKMKLQLDYDRSQEKVRPMVYQETEGLF